MSGWLTNPLPVFPAMLDQSHQGFCSPAQRGQTRGSGTPSSLPELGFLRSFQADYPDSFAAWRGRGSG